MKNRMDELKESLTSIIDVVPNKDDVFYIDYPLYHNVGDLLIMEGALRLFESHGVNIRLYQSAENYSIRMLKGMISPNTTIICQGGGNFGDLYHTHQNIREDIVSNFPNNTIIIMPQTAHFSSEEALHRTIELFKKHKSLVMYARDINTYNLFSKMTDKCFLMTDTAHFLYHTLPISKKRNDTLYFLRKDIEINPAQEAYTKLNIKSVDWEDVLLKSDILKMKVIKNIAKKKSFSPFFSKLVFLLWRSHSNKLINRYAKLFSSYNEVITSRMHGHILACLVDTNNKVIDNSYGKNSGYYNQWTKKSNVCSLLDSE